MPRPAKIDRHTHAMTEPEDWDAEKDGRCQTLYVRMETDGDTTYMNSAWDFEAAESLELLAGGKAILGICGTKHPVVHMALAQLPDSFPPVHTVREIAMLDGRAAVRVDSMYCGPEGQGAHRVFCEMLVEDGDVPAATASAMRETAAFARQNGVLP